MAHNVDQEEIKLAEALIEASDKARDLASAKCALGDTWGVYRAMALAVSLEGKGRRIKQHGGS